MGISQEYDAQMRVLSGNGQPGIPNGQSLKGLHLKKVSSTLLTFVLVFATTLTLVQNSALSLRHEQSTEKTKNNLGQ
jgi:hypothetical protein